MLKIKDIPEDQILFYDCETDHQFASYAELRVLGVQLGLRGRPYIVDDWGERKRVREMFNSPDVLKVGYNNGSFDDIVLWRHGFPVNETNRHDMFLAVKTVAPALPAYSLKYVNFHFFGDPHFLEGKLEAWEKKTQLDKWSAPPEILNPYCLYDIYETRQIFLLVWERLQRDPHWRAYTEVELPTILPLEEMMVRGGEYLNACDLEAKLVTLQREKEYWNEQAYQLSGGAIINANSVKQVGGYLDLEGFEIALTDAGNWSLPKNELLDLRDDTPIAECTLNVRRINNAASYYKNYLEALDHDDNSRKLGWIPKQFSLSRARTRRILSNSLHGINFQNASKEAKAVQLVPPGWLGWWIDATQIENIYHIYLSNDRERREAYEADPDWSEYVWLCNRILGTNHTKKELDDRNQFPAPSNPTWSIYKLYKTIKLAMNFGMGIDKFSKHTGLRKADAIQPFADVKRACPAIESLQRKLIDEFREHGRVTDVFGHIYAANPKKAYRIVAYLIQGCGTGSLPKAHTRAHYDAVHQWDCNVTTHELNPIHPYLLDKPRGVVSYGHLCGTIHDETAGRLSLGLGADRIVATLRLIMDNATQRFQHLFDNIPLRAKLALSRTTAGEAEEVDLNDPSTYQHYLQ